MYAKNRVHVCFLGPNAAAAAGYIRSVVYRSNLAGGGLYFPALVIPHGVVAGTLDGLPPVASVSELVLDACCIGVAALTC